MKKNDKKIETLFLDKELEERFNKEQEKIEKYVNKQHKTKKIGKLFFYYLVLFISIIVFIFSKTNLRYVISFPKRWLTNWVRVVTFT